MKKGTARLLQFCTYNPEKVKQIWILTLEKQVMMSLHQWKTAHYLKGPLLFPQYLISYDDGQIPSLLVCRLPP